MVSLLDRTLVTSFCDGAEPSRPAGHVQMDVGELLVAVYAACYRQPNPIRFPGQDAAERRLKIR